MLIIPKKNLHSTRVYQTRVQCKFFFAFNDTQAWYTRVLCCMLLEFTKLEYHIIFFNRTNSNSAVPRWQNRWGTRVSEIRVLEKVILCHLFSKQCFFTKNFQKMWYLAILAKICSIRKIGQNTTIRLGLDLAFAFYVCVFSFFFFFFFFIYLFFFKSRFCWLFNFTSWPVKTNNQDGGPHPMND